MSALEYTHSHTHTPHTHPLTHTHIHHTQSATAGEIKRAYRQLSLKLHPDKSDDPDAAAKFRKVRI